MKIISKPSDYFNKGNEWNMSLMQEVQKIHDFQKAIDKQAGRSNSVAVLVTSKSYAQIH